MARLVVALIALSIMSAGSMYWAAAQQTPDQASGWAVSQVKASAYDAFKPAGVETPSQDSSTCANSGGCSCGGAGNAGCANEKKEDAKKKSDTKTGGGCPCR